MSDSPKSGAGVAPARIMSIDALRGFDMFWICGGRPVVLALIGLFWNPLPGWLNYQLSHVEWMGFSAWDMIMPLFLFVVGASMPFSFARRAGQPGGTWRLYLKILRRVLILWVLGMVAQGRLLEFNTSRLFLFSNTLQAIAVGYLVAAVLLLNVSVLGQFVAMVVLLVAYWLIMVLVPVPGHAAGILEPKLNVALYVDEIVLGRFRDGTTYTWVLGGMGFAGTVLLGVMAGHLLRSSRSGWSKVFLLTVAGVACLGLGRLWGHWFPIIKHAWTSSMVLWAGGWSLLLLAVFYMTIDVIGWRRWAFPFVVIGMNAIAVYMGVRIIRFDDIANTLVGGLAKHTAVYADLLKSSVSFALVWLVLYYMYRNRTFIKI